MSEILAYYIDDQASSDAHRYQERLSRAIKFNCKLFSPPKWGNLDEIVAIPPDLFLIDYELGLVQQDGTFASYQGSTLAAELRTRLPDCPIVLITRESILGHLNRQTRRQLTKDLKIYDELIFKSSLDNELDITRQLLISLSEGFKELGSVASRNWRSLVEALGADEEEADQLREAAPPLEEGEWIVTSAANWIRNIVLCYPGILYDPIYTATQLGISIESFHNEAVQGLFTPAKYSGLFSFYEGRWWKNRFFRIAKDFTVSEGLNGTLSEVFKIAFHQKYGIELLPAVCVWDHTPTADWVCYILHQPVKINNSLRYYPDSRPSVMDPARVSFRAIRESEEFDEDLLDAEGIRLLKEVEALPEP